MAVNPLEIYLNQGQRDMIVSILTGMDNMDVIIPPNEHVKKNMETMGLENVSEPVPPMIDLEKWEEVRKPPEDKEDIIVSATRLSPIKNLELAIFSMKSVLEDNPNARYEIYGEGQDMKYLSNLVNKLIGTERIEIKGFEDPKKIYERGKVFLQLSLSENLSLSPLEAKASGLPVVVSDIPGHDGGIRVGHDKMYQVKEKVDRLLNDPEYAEETIEEGYKGLGKYKPENVIPKYRDIFNMMLNMKDFKKQSKEQWGDLNV